MKSSTRLLLLLAVLLSSLTASGQTLIARRAMETLQPDSYPIPGSHLLEEANKSVAAYVAQHPESVVRSRLLKPAWSFIVGSTHTWKATNIGAVPNTYYDVPSTCRAVGTHCYMFVEDAIWGTRVDQSAVDAVMNAFDNQTPADPAKGVYQMDVETFGTPPDIDGDARIIILILDIQDGYTGSGSYVAGYFWGGNEVQNYPNGNNAEIYYVDANPVDLSTTSGVTAAMSTAAHEFQHMIHYGKDPSEITFVNEGCSCFAQSNCGYGIREQNSYVNETNHYLLDWRGTGNVNVPKDYSRAGRFFQYFGDQFGVGVFMPIVASGLHGIDGLNAGLSNYGAGRNFAQIFQDWLVANILDDRTVNSKYGYIYLDLPKAVGTAYLTPNVSLTSGTVQALAGQYLSYTGGSNLKFTLTTSSDSLIIKAVEIGSPSRVLDVTPGVEFDEPGFGTTYSAVHIVVINTGYGTPANFSFQSSGNSVTSVELKYEETDPVGYLGLAAGDSACVWFTGAPGARLDSIRVALHSVGSVSGGIYRYTGNQQPTPLGTKIQVPVSATRSGSSPWVKIDLRSYNIDASSNFIVAFPYVGTASTNPRVMVGDAAYTSGDVFHSYTYYTEGTTDGWYILTDSQSPGNAFAYAIRAYLSFGATDVQEPVRQLPLAMQLEQNYPNPFNPSTQIKYTVGGVRDQGPGVSRIRLVVYDLLGRQVAVLVDEQKPAGEYQVRFDGSGLPSGVYYCRLTSENHTQTRAMMLVK